MISDKEMAPMREMTFGEKAVGLTFNPSGDASVNTVKQMFADIITEMNRLRGQASDGEIKRMFSVAITEAQSAQMWAVKAITWRY